MAAPLPVLHYGPAAAFQVGPARSSEGDLAELDTVQFDALIPCAVFPSWRSSAIAAGSATCRRTSACIPASPRPRSSTISRS